MPLENPGYGPVLSWTPVVTASGAMTVSGLTISQATYYLLGRRVGFDLTLLFTLGGTQDNAVVFTLPLTGVAHSNQCLFPANTADNGGFKPGGAWRAQSSTTGNVYLPAIINWTLGANATISIQGSYQLL